MTAKQKEKKLHGAGIDPGHRRRDHKDHRRAVYPDPSYEYLWATKEWDTIMLRFPSTQWPLLLRPTACRWQCPNWCPRVLR